VAQAALFSCLEQNQNHSTQRTSGQTAFFLKKNATWRIFSGYTYSDFALKSRARILKGHGFSRAITEAESSRLQPRRELLLADSLTC
jgi:hypothetical protein